MIERLTCKLLLLGLLDQYIQKHLLCCRCLSLIMHLLCTIVNCGSRAELFRRTMAGHATLVAVIHVLLGLVLDTCCVVFVYTQVLLTRQGRLVIHVELTNFVLDLTLDCRPLIFLARWPRRLV